MVQFLAILTVIAIGNLVVGYWVGMRGRAAASSIPEQEAAASESVAEIAPAPQTGESETRAPFNVRDYVLSTIGCDEAA